MKGVRLKSVDYSICANKTRQIPCMPAGIRADIEDRVSCFYNIISYDLCQRFIDKMKM